MWNLLLLLSASTPVSSCGSSGPLALFTQPLHVRVGQKVRLDASSNREDLDARFHWELVERPTGGRPEVGEADGVSTLTGRNCEVVYDHPAVPTFVADQPGRYVLRVEVTDLATQERAEAQLLIQAVESWPKESLEPPSTGCSVAPGWPLGALGVLLTRRRARR